MTAARKRLFFALWPDDPVRHALFHWQVANLDERVRWQHRADLHMTLHFLGMVDTPRIGVLRELGAGLSAATFTLRLDQVGHWPRPQVLWVAPTEVPDALTEMYAWLGEGLVARGFEVETRAYRPHVTLARKVRKPPAVSELKPIDWQVRELVLVESRTGAAPMYQPLARWALH